MSKPRYDWWPYIKGMIRRYPALAAEYEELKQTKITTQFSGMPHGAGISDPTAAAALRQMSTVNQIEYSAVHNAIETTKTYRDGEARIKVIKLVYWDRTHRLVGAAMEVHSSEPTVIRWHGEFIRLVAQNFGLLEEAG